MTARRYRELDRLAAEHGFTFTGFTGRDHRRYTDHRGRTVVTASTPSDRRSLANTRAEFRRAAQEEP